MMMYMMTIKKSLIELINMDVRVYAKQEKKNTKKNIEIRKRNWLTLKSQMLQLLVHVC